MLHDFTPTTFYYTFGPHQPALRVRPGDTIVTQTLDSGSRGPDGEVIPEEMRHQPPGTRVYAANPQTGPFYVEGAKVDDTLAVQVEEITPSRAWAESRFNPGFGVFAPEDRACGPTGLGEPLPERSFIWELDLDRNVGWLALPESALGSVEIPLHPFFGCIGTAPRFGEVISTITPAEHGGNMDCVDTGIGATVYLPVFVDGAYLMFGDVHAAQGDGEACGVGLETPSEVQVTVDLIQGKAIRWPRIEDDTHIMVAASTRPLIDAYRIAHVELIRWLAADYGYDQWEAMQLVSQVGTARVGNVVDPRYTVVAKISKTYLPE
jgi:amidase